MLTLVNDRQQILPSEQDSGIGVTRYDREKEAEERKTVCQHFDHVSGSVWTEASGPSIVIITRGAWRLDCLSLLLGCIALR